MGSTSELAPLEAQYAEAVGDPERDLGAFLRLSLELSDAVRAASPDRAEAIAIFALARLGDLPAVDGGPLAGPDAAEAHELASELADRAGRPELAYRHLRAARELERAAGVVVLPDHADADAVVDITASSDAALVELEQGDLSLEQLVARTRELQEALIDLRSRGGVDELTGLANRQRLQEVLAELHARGESITVFAIDVDRFGRVNESLGHREGDELLVELARRLVRAVRSVDLVARWGGDEFVVLVPAPGDASSTIHLAEAIRQAVSRPWRSPSGVVIGPSVSIGVAMAPAPGGTPVGAGAAGASSVAAEDLLRHADTALDWAKAQGKDRIAVFGDALGVDARRRFDVEHLLRLALERNLFELHYQPVHPNSTGAPLAAEALIRLRHPSGALWSPGEFLDVAEETGLSVPIGGWVLRAACRDAATWINRGEPFRVAVNVSASQLDADFPEVVADALARSSVPASLLVIELTEHTLLSAGGDQVEALERIRSTGVRIALDDFGTGSSSFEHLRRLPVDVVKIDQSFVRGMMDNERDAAIVEAIVQLSHTFRFGVIAEGIETAWQFDQQRRLGCHGAQGFLIGRPKPAPVFSELLATRRMFAAITGMAAV